MQALQERAPGPVPEDLVEHVRLAERGVVRGRQGLPRRRVLDLADVDDVLLLELRIEQEELPRLLIWAAVQCLLEEVARALELLLP